MRVLDLFSGIGGFSLGLERAGMTTAMFCEIEPFCRQVLAKHWPGVPIHDDVRTLDRLVVAEKAGAVDLVCGGFPCQDISVAGKGAGLGGARSGLWFEYRRIIEEVAPRWVVIENVPALRSRGMDTVLGGLAALGYDAEWHCIPASALGAPHRRDRVWLVAHASRNVRAWAETSGAERERAWPGGAGGGTRDVAHANGDSRASGPLHADEGPGGGNAGGSGVGADVADAHHPRLEIVLNGASGQQPASVGAHAWAVEPNVGGDADGLSCGLVGAAGWERGAPRTALGVPNRVARLRALGNAVVPQVVEVIGRAIMAAETGRGG